MTFFVLHIMYWGGQRRRIVGQPEWFNASQSCPAMIIAHPRSKMP